MQQAVEQGRVQRDHLAGFFGVLVDGALHELRLNMHEIGAVLGGKQIMLGLKVVLDAVSDESCHLGAKFGQGFQHFGRGGLKVCGLLGAKCV